MSYLYSNSIVFAGHPDRVADKIADTVAGEFVAINSNCQCSVDVVLTETEVILRGFTSVETDIDLSNIVNKVLLRYGLITRNVLDGVVRGVNTSAGEPFVVHGFASRDTSLMIPKAMAILQDLAREYDKLCMKDKRFLPSGSSMLEGVYSESGDMLCVSSISIVFDKKKSLPIKEGVVTLSKIVASLLAKWEVTGAYELDIQYEPAPTVGVSGRRTHSEGYQSFSQLVDGSLSGRDFKNTKRTASYLARQLAMYMLKTRKDLQWCRVQASYKPSQYAPSVVTISSDKGVLNIASAVKKYLNVEYAKKNGISGEFCDLSFGSFGNSQFPWEDSV
jgi:S-adenosylmethionine synthetase